MSKHPEIGPDSGFIIPKGVKIDEGSSSIAFRTWPEGTSRVVFPKDYKRKPVVDGDWVIQEAKKAFKGTRWISHEGYDAVAEKFYGPITTDGMRPGLRIYHKASLPGRFAVVPWAPPSRDDGYRPKEEVPALLEKWREGHPDLIDESRKSTGGWIMSGNTDEVIKGWAKALNGRSLPAMREDRGENPT